MMTRARYAIETLLPASQKRLVVHLDGDGHYLNCKETKPDRSLQEMTLSEATIHKVIWTDKKEAVYQRLANLNLKNETGMAFIAVLAMIPNDFQDLYEGVILPIINASQTLLN